MKSGEHKHNETLNKCHCGCDGIVIWHYIKGIANRIHYFVKCKNCLNRTRDRVLSKNAINDWNIGNYRK